MNLKLNTNEIKNLKKNYILKPYIIKDECTFIYQMYPKSRIKIITVNDWEYIHLKIGTVYVNINPLKLPFSCPNFCTKFIIKYKTKPKNPPFLHVRHPDEPTILDFI